MIYYSYPYFIVRRCLLVFFVIKLFYLFPSDGAPVFILPQKVRRLWLLLSSYFFYLCAGAEYVPFLLAVTVLTYWGGRKLEGRDQPAKKKILAVLLVLFFGTLFLLKYLDFSFSLVQTALSTIGFSFTGPALALILPAGISYYLFMAASYLIDVYRGKERAEGNIISLALLLSFFPHVISGPIGRSGDLLPQFHQLPEFEYQRLKEGLLRFLWGAFKKLCLSDRLALVVTTVFDQSQSMGSLQVLFGILAFTLQLYCDFSGYSDMAIGSAHAMGFTLMENFRSPLFSKSVSEFWRRWHISLSSWFRDYLYFPLGGSRKGKGRKYINVLIVFAVSGLWHGAAITFLIWGLLNGLYQVVGEMTQPVRKRLTEGLHPPERLFSLWQMGWTYLWVAFAFTFFNASSMGQALTVFKSLFNTTLVVAPTLYTMGWDKYHCLAAVVAFFVVIVVDMLSAKGSVSKRVVALPRYASWPLILVLLFATIILGIYGTAYDAQAFIYFKF